MGHNFQQAETRLAVGDMLLCYSDAVTESQDPSGKMLGIEGLKNLLNSDSETPPEELVSTIVKQLQEHSPDGFADDTSLILIEADGSSAGAKDTALAPFRLLSSLFNRSGSVPS